MMETPANTFSEQKQLQSHLHSHSSPIDQPHKCYNLSTNREAGEGSDSTNEDELSPDFITPVICDQDGSTSILHRAVLPQSISEEPEVFDDGNNTYSQETLTSLGEDTSPLSVCKSSHNTTSMAFTSLSLLELCTLSDESW